MSSTGPSTAPNQCGVKVVNSTASPADRGRVLELRQPKATRRDVVRFRLDPAPAELFDLGVEVSQSDDDVRDGGVVGCALRDSPHRGLAHTSPLDNWRDAFTTIATQNQSGAIKVGIDQR